MAIVNARLELMASANHRKIVHQVELTLDTFTIAAQDDPCRGYINCCDTEERVLLWDNRRQDGGREGYRSAEVVEVQGGAAILVAPIGPDFVAYRRADQPGHPPSQSLSFE